MTRRHGSWHLVGRDSDPVPASEWDVKTVARTYERRGEDLRETHDTLKRLSRLDGWRGKAAETFAESADDRLGDLDKAASKYEKAGEALRTYADAVADARSETSAALADAEDADARRRANAGDPLAGVAEPTDEQTDAAERQTRRHDRAVSEISAASGRVDTAMAVLAAAARSCASRIRTASESFEDHWFKDDFIRRNLDFFKIACKVLEVVAVAIAVAALALALVASAPFALIVAGIAVAALLVLARSALVISDTGSATWADVGWDVIGLGLSVVGGRAALNLARQSGSLGRSFAALRTAAVTSARGRLTPMPRFLLRIQARPGLFGGLLRGVDNWRVGRLAAPSLSQIDDIVSLRAGWGARLRVLDKDMATMRAQLAALDNLTLPGVNVPQVVGQLDDLRSALGPAIRWNLVNTGVSTDTALGLADASPTAPIRSGLERAHWRVTVAGR